MDEATAARILEQIDEKETVEFCSDLLRIPSFKTEETPVATYLATFFGDRGYDVQLQEVEPGRFQTIATLKGSGGGQSLMLNGHMDIDPLAFGLLRDPWVPSWEGDRLYGGGSNNMKGGLTSIITAAEAIRKSGIEMKGDLVVACVAGELQGGVGTTYALRNGLRTDAAIVAEPVGDADNIITTHVGWVEMAISTIGLSQHVSRSHLAVDAIDMMIKAIPAIKNVQFAHTPRADLPDMPRIIIGTILGGRGKDHDMRGPNFTCDYCTVVADIRTLPGQTADMVIADVTKVLEAIKAEDPTFNYEIEAPPPAHYKVQTVYMEPFDVPQDLPIVQCLSQNFRSFAGRDPDKIGAVVTQSYAGNDSCHLWEADIPCCLYGPQGGRDRQGEPDGFVSVSSMVRVAQVLALTSADWCNQPG